MSEERADGWQQASMAPSGDQRMTLEIIWMGNHVRLGAVKMEVRELPGETLVAMKSTANLENHRIEQVAALYLTEFLTEADLLLANIEPF